MKHLIICPNGTALTAVCGRRMPRSKPNGHEFHYRFGEADLRERGVPPDLDCSICRPVAEKTAGGVLLSYAVREVRHARRGTA